MFPKSAITSNSQPLPHLERRGNMGRLTIKAPGKIPCFNVIHDAHLRLVWFISSFACE